LLNLHFVYSLNLLSSLKTFISSYLLGRTYRFRVHNSGIATSLNFRIQNHNLLLVETEGSYTIQQNYTNMDIHVGQSFSFLITMDQSGSNDYYIVASPRFATSVKASGVAVLRYSNSQGSASGPLPDPPIELDTFFSMNQARSLRLLTTMYSYVFILGNILARMVFCMKHNPLLYFYSKLQFLVVADGKMMFGRLNLSSGAARPNPQGSFKYGQITVTDVYVIVNRPPEMIEGRLRATLNGISYLPPSTPLKLAQQYNISGVYKLDFPKRPMNRHPRVDTSVINGTFKGFVEIIFQNSDTTVKSYHLDGYAFFVVG